ncbi:MAG TPA: RHS repeat-associated core domain-containing protein [Candidatus Bathyarchaeia archaeon]|nr:RHS repeat-associated core domain-containing protein [Candidatus Bathyarchaeia archaeon]
MITYSDATYVYLNSYQPFGQDNGTPRGSFLSRATDKFAGERLSVPTGLYYDYQRWYDPTIGRFISPDPRHGRLSNPQSLNLYIYVIDQPTDRADPTGEADSARDRPYIQSGPDPLFTAVSNWWNNQDQSTKIAIILVVATVAIVATAGVAAPALVPLIATGIALGATTSVATYAATTIATGGTITAQGLFASAAIGAFTGAATAGLLGAFSGVGSEAVDTVESVAQSEADTGVNLSSHFLTETDHLSQVAKAFTGYSGNTADAMSLISDTLDTGNVNLAESTGSPMRIAFEKVLAGRSGPLGLRAVWDFNLGELWTAYPFPVVD